MKVSLRDDHTKTKFFLRTFAAQLHFFGVFALAIGSLYLLPLVEKHGPLHYYACVCFIFTGVVLFLVSATYHFLTDGFEGSPRLHLFFENLDHFCIYLFIAGTYSPFLLNSVSEPWKVPLLYGIWAIAFLGIIYTWMKPKLPAILQHRMIYTGLFLAMGWVMLIRMGDVVRIQSPKSLIFTTLGGIFYSVGAVIYATRRPRLLVGIFGFHELWHLFVLFGAAAHFGMIYSFYAH